MKFLVLGASGMAGHMISLFLLQKGHEVVTFSRKKIVYCKNINGNIKDENFLKTLLLEQEYDVIINCIGILNEKCNEDISEAIYINSYLPHLISDILKNTNKYFIQISTDCVFSGNMPPYNEKSFKDGQSIYAQTKSLGEINDEKNLTIRTSIIGPDMSENGIGLFNWFMKQKNTVYGFKRVIWNGVTTLVLAKAIENASLIRMTGIYNFASKKGISKYDLLNLINKNIRKDNMKIIADEKIVNSKYLISDRKENLLDIPSYESMIKEMDMWIKNNKHLYKHYFNK